MIDLRTAAELLDFGARIGGGQRAQEQLEGAVALHDILCRRGVAYLADEVGMGKTYVALGVLALFRHFEPTFRVLVLSPRENIQQKWMKELGNFVRHNVRFADMRVKALDGRPARALVSCSNLLDLVRETGLDDDRDFFGRFSSFSLPLSGDTESWQRARDSFRKHLSWVDPEVFDLRVKKEAFKDNFARAVCCALPVFDLVIVDEAHNLKHGFREQAAARNRVLGLAFGHPSEKTDRRRLFPGYGCRAKRVLFLSATPIEETYTHLWNQLDLFGHAKGFEGLRDPEVSEDEKKKLAAEVLVRRVTSIQVNGAEHTKNLYRREWRRGGVAQHDQPIRVEDDRQRLVVALVQKKVSEVLGDERFNASFQIGMLASFESFLQTAGVKRDDEEASNFDDPDQTEEQQEREGIDVGSVNGLARDYRKRFDGQELPHPKMDAVVESLAGAWTGGRKALVFVRRVASVKELKRKLDDRYDMWLIETLRSRLPAEVRPKLDQMYAQYRAEKVQARDIGSETPTPGGGVPGRPGATGDDEDRGGTDTFFAWFFRGHGPKGVISGANVQQRFVQRGATYATFFEDNHVMALLGARPQGVTTVLAEALGMPVEALRAELRRRSARFLSSKAKKHARGDRFEAVQAASIELLKDREGPLCEAARVIWHDRYEAAAKKPYTKEPPAIGDWLELPTFWTELRERPRLRARLWPEPRARDFRDAFREREQRAQLLATTARLGHALIDLYVMTIGRIRSLDLRAHEVAEDDATVVDKARIDEYLDLLEGQMAAPLTTRSWGAFDELAAVADHFELILDVNAPDARTRPPSETARVFGDLLRRQQPVGGMSGQVNGTLVKQFRMPGYPLVLVTTDLLQEGEDLHTFCSAVHHYGISWTPSAMEQRIGRIDRVLSQTDRRLSGLAGELGGEDMLQVYYPHLEDTVEVLQVHRVLERMNVFLRLMHEGLGQGEAEQRKLDVAKEIVGGRRYVEPIRTRLRSAFPVPRSALSGGRRGLAVDPAATQAALARFDRLRSRPFGTLRVALEETAPTGVLLGTVQLDRRQQPFALYLQSFGERPLVRCISPVGRVSPDEGQDAIAEEVSALPVRLGVIDKEEGSYDLTVEEDVLLAAEEHDAERIAALIGRVAAQADRLEQHHLPGHDEPLATFRSDLEKELTDGA
ncbi:helicase-related protein [Sorangium sp. KYC3313]|uniref:helicase-related protein n=1 Tax=Sorangium sp. KYC3313 TaxID=3449740 RepID=UPI003F8CCB3E